MPHAAGLWYEWHGPEDGEVLILSPGLGGSAKYWAPNLAALAQLYRVLAYDHRGTGRSARELSRDVTVEDMAGDLLALMDGLGLPSATLIGHAAGGVIGLALALRAPERLDGLVIVNGWSWPDPHFVRCLDTRIVLLHGGADAFLHAQPLFLYPARWSSANDGLLIAEEALQRMDFPGITNVEARIAALIAFDIDARLAEIGTATLLIAAEDDMLVPASCSERLAEGLPGATLERTTGGHACNVTCPDQFNRTVLAWLEGRGNEGAQ